MSGTSPLDAGRADEAESDFTRALAIYERLISEDRSTPQYRMQSARVLGDLGLLRLRAGRNSDALASLGSSHEILARLVAEYPTIAMFRADLGHAAVRLALATERGGDRTTALRLARSGVDLLDALPAPSARYVSYQAKAHAVLGTMVDRESQHGTAIERLRVAIRRGYRNLLEYRRDPSFDPIRSRPEFQGLLLDLSFPADPFARAG